MLGETKLKVYKPFLSLEDAKNGRVFTEESEGVWESWDRNTSTLWRINRFDRP